MKDRDEESGKKAFGLGIFVGAAFTSLVWVIALQDPFAAGLIAMTSLDGRDSFHVILRQSSDSQRCFAMRNSTYIASQENKFEIGN